MAIESATATGVSGQRARNPAADHLATRIVAVAVIAVFFELYDFVVYGYMVTHIAKAMFVSSNDFFSFLAALATFGAGFVMRPVGAVVLGGFTDRSGRRAGLTLSIVLMTLGTAIVGLTPSHAAIGAAAPVIFVIGRLVQGFSVGGAVGGAAALLIEQAPRHRRGLIGSYQQIGQGAAFVLGAAGAAAATALLSPAQMDAWGWRLPFLFGLLILPVGLYARKFLLDVGEDAPKRIAHPARELLRDHRARVVRGSAIVALGTVGVYACLIYLPTFAARELAIPAAATLAINASCGIVFILAAIASGRWSDRVGRSRPALIGAVGLFVLVYPLIALLVARPGIPALLTAQFSFALLVGIYNGPALTLVSELFPQHVRASGYSLSYNVAVVSFGGFAPFIVTWLIEATGAKTALAFYVMAAAAIGGVAMLGRPKAHPNA